MSTGQHRWADRAMFEASPISHTQPEVFLLWATPDPLGAIAAACRMYEGIPTRSLDDINDTERLKYWTEVFNTHLHAPLEFVKLHFFIEAVTRSFTHQIVRQRTAVYAQESLRFAVKENLVQETPIPPSVVKDQNMKEFWEQTVARIEKSYKTMINAGIPAEDARGLLPHATTTRLHYCTDFRNLIEVAGNRLCTQAAFEWRGVMLSLMQAIRQYRNQDKTAWQFEVLGSPHPQTFTPVCYRLGRCPFMAVFDRDCTIRERVNQGRFNEIDPDEWMADPTAGRRSI